VRPEEGTIQSRARAIETLFGLVPDSVPVIICNGFPSREAFRIGDRPTHFYMLGSMGMAAAIGLGVAQAKPNKKVVVLDGDGNVLMGLGTLATAGALRLKNFIHVVLDNEVYGSSGNQPSYSQVVRLDQMAKAAGYVNVERVREREDLVYEFNDMLGKDGPSFLLVKVTEQAEDVGWVPLEPAQITQRFKQALE
jgi:thiamine pyrophosphate-dependent acetolactate synthase large subunit-like protein